MHARPPPQDLRSHRGPHRPPPLPRADSEPGHHCLGSRVSRCCRVPSPHRWIRRGHLPFQVPPGFAGRCCGPGAAPGGGQGVLMPPGRLLLFAHIPWSGTGENAEPCSPRAVPWRWGHHVPWCQRVPVPNPAPRAHPQQWWGSRGSSCGRCWGCSWAAPCGQDPGLAPPGGRIIGGHPPGRTP